MKKMEIERKLYSVVTPTEYSNNLDLYNPTRTALEVGDMVLPVRNSSVDTSVTAATTTLTNSNGKFDVKDGTLDAHTIRDYSLDSNIEVTQALQKMQTALIQANNVGTANNRQSTITNVRQDTTSLYAANSPANGLVQQAGTAIDGTALTDYTFDISIGQMVVANSLAFDLHVGADADMTNKISVDIDAMTASGLGIKGLNVVDDSGMAATYAIDAIADALAKVSAQRGELGAVQNRLEHTIANLDNVVENTTAAESRIRDTDMAAEMVEYSKNNILAQAGQSMLAQANQSTQGVMSLLQ